MTITLHITSEAKFFNRIPGLPTHKHEFVSHHRDSQYGGIFLYLLHKNKVILYHIQIKKIHSMEIFNLIFGLLIIGTGFFVKAYPNTIAGYNTMSKEQKMNVDIGKASTFIRNGFIVLGLIIILGFYLIKWIGLIAVAHYITMIATILGTIIIVIMAQKFDHNKQKKS
jgi:hypothetical protein